MGAYKTPCYFDQTYILLSKRRKTCALRARKVKNENVIMVVEKVCEDWRKGDRAARRVGKDLSLEGIVLPFANIYPVSCIHSDEYASPAFKKLTVKLERQLCTPMLTNVGRIGKWTSEEKEKNLFSLETLISERNAASNASGN